MWDIKPVVKKPSQKHTVAYSTHAVYGREVFHQKSQPKQPNMKVSYNCTAL